MDADIKALMAALLAENLNTARATTELIATVNRQAQLADARTARLEESHLRLEALHAQTEEALARFIASGEERTKRLEESLDNLMRAIAADHKNGKGR